MDAFKARFRHVDVLLVDDVQFLTSKAHTEEEFFHTFNALHDAGAQLVLTSDRRRATSGALEDRLRERFEAGLLTDIAAPDRDTRLTILRKRVQHDAIAIGDPGALEVIADRIADSVAALEGALIRVVAYASMTAEPLTAELATARPRRALPRPQARAALDRGRPAHDLRGLLDLPRRISSRAGGRSGSCGRASSPCTSRAS